MRLWWGRPDPESGTFSPLPKVTPLGKWPHHFLWFFSQFENDCKVGRSKIQLSGGIFPLPERLWAIREVVGHLPQEQLMVLCGVCKALNSYNGSPAADRPLVTAAARMALTGLAASVRDSELPWEKFQGLKWRDFLDVRTVDYRGKKLGLQSLHMVEHCTCTSRRNRICSPWWSLWIGYLGLCDEFREIPFTGRVKGLYKASSGVCPGCRLGGYMCWTSWQRVM